MNVILLSGGSGKLLWPLSNEVRSKQFIKIFKKEDGTYESILQRAYRQIKSVDKNATVTVVASREQIPSIKNQLDDNVHISVEPCRKDTFPAVALASMYLANVEGIDENEPVVVSPVDLFVDEEYYKALENIYNQVNKAEANLVLMGIEPTAPSSKYGYIIPATKEDVSGVDTFKEKPSEAQAKKYMEQGALWNGGVFGYKLKYVIDKAQEIIGYSDYYDLYEKYRQIKKISFDYAVVENESKIQVVRFAGLWKDIYNWSKMTEAMEEPVIGKGIIGEGCADVNIVNETDVPILAVGLTDVVISASSQGILVSDKNKSSYIDTFIDALGDDQIMFAEKSWGSYEVVDVDEHGLTIKITLNEGHSMNYHSHNHRDEVWVVISGNGYTVVDGMRQKVHAGDVITMSSGCRHTVFAETELKLIEVQIGKDISADDKKKYELE